MPIGQRRRRLIALFAALGLCLAQATAAAELTLISLNLAHGRGNAFSQLLLGEQDFRANLAHVAGTLAPLQPDILGLQEADGPSQWSGDFDHVAFLGDALALPGRAHGRHIDNWALSYGTAVLARLPLEESLVHHFAGSFPTPNKGFTLARLRWQWAADQPPVALDVVSLHLDFSRQAVRLAQIDELVQVLAQRAAPLIVMGDFNNARVAHTLLPARMAAVERRLRAHPQADQWPTYGDKVLDWILISDELAFEDYRVLADQLSDHRAVLARVSLRPVPDQTQPQ